MKEIIYLVQRMQMGLEDSPSHRFDVFPERAFSTEQAAKDYCLSLDSTGKGFEYECPCGCGDRHWRAWDVMAIVYEEN